MRLQNPVEYLTTPRVLAPGTPVEVHDVRYDDEVWVEALIVARAIRGGVKGYMLAVPWVRQGYWFYPDVHLNTTWRLSKT